MVAWRLWQLDYFWTNPLDGVVVQRLTDFAGDEIDAAISPDGNVTPFVSDRDGPFDVWISPTGIGRFVNATKGRFPAIYPGPIRYVGFSDDSSQIWFLEQVPLRPNRLRTWLTPVVPGDIVRSSKAGCILPGRQIESAWCITRPTKATRSLLPIVRATTGARSMSTNPVFITITLRGRRTDVISTS